MKITKIGCPILADYSSLLPHNDDTSSSGKLIKSALDVDYSVPHHTKDRQPIITPFVDSDDNGDVPAGSSGSKGEQYLLIPQREKISVLSMKHGQLVTELTPCPIRRRRRRGGGGGGVGGDKTKEKEEEEDEGLVINTVALGKVGRVSPPSSSGNGSTVAGAWANALLGIGTITDGGTKTKTLPNPLQLALRTNDTTTAKNDDTKEEEWVILAGLSDGTIHEWPLSSIHSSSFHNKMELDDEDDASDGGILPSRIFKLSTRGPSGPISHIASSTSTSSTSLGLVHALAFIHNTSNSNSSSKKKKPKPMRQLLRIVLPNIPYDGAEGDCHVVSLSSPGSSNEEDGEGSGGQVRFVTDYCLSGRQVHTATTVGEGGEGKVKKRVSYLPFQLLCSPLPKAEYGIGVGVDGNDGTSSSSSSIVTVIQKDEFQIYLDDGTTNGTKTKTNMPPFENIQTMNKSEVTTATISPDGRDLALGFKDGSITVYVSIYTMILAHIHERQPPPLDSNTAPLKIPNAHPLQTKLLLRKIHWHALPVKTLSYTGLSPSSRAAPNLLSGGEEAVLCTWNLELGSDKPVHRLPRITKGCITHVVTNSFGFDGSGVGGSEDVVVRCADNTVQLIQGHNHAVRWKIQGLASASNECVPIGDQTTNNHNHSHNHNNSSTQSQSPSSPILQIDTKTQIPILTRLTGAPGYIHWFDPNVGRVVGELEVAPYNRVSRRHQGMDANPRPRVTQLVMGRDGEDMITIDTMLTEDGSLMEGDDGGYQHKHDPPMSLVTNIKFWAWSKELEATQTQEACGVGMPYELISAMPSPHGTMNGDVDALAITPDGSTACSLSNREGAFHIWRKTKDSSGSVTRDRSSSFGGADNNRNNNNNNNNNNTSNPYTPPVPVWKRDCKISIPSGHSNSPGNGAGKDTNGVISFSSDASVLIIAFGRHVTIWDHSDMTILNTVLAPEHILDLRFVSSPKDMMLAVGASSVSLLPPFGEGYIGDSSWCYKLPVGGSTVDGYDLSLGLVTPLQRGTMIAAALHMKVTTDKDDDLHRSNNNKNNGQKREPKRQQPPMIQTKIVLIDATTGSPKMMQDGTTPIYWTVRGRVECMCDISYIDDDEWSSSTSNNNATATNGGGCKSMLLVLTHEHEMFKLEKIDDSVTTTSTTEEHSSMMWSSGSKRGRLSRIENEAAPALTSVDAPTLRVGGQSRHQEQPGIVPDAGYPVRLVEDDVNFASFLFDSSSTSGMNTTKATTSSSGSKGGVIPTHMLPALSGAFTSAFIGRSFKRKEFSS